MNLEVASERSNFLNEKLYFQRLRNEMKALLSGLHVASTGCCQSSFMNKSSSFGFYGIAEGVPGSECVADDTSANI